MKTTGIFLIFLSILSLPLFAATFKMLGSYRDVEVVSVSSKGIKILHSKGVSTITEENLSEAEKSLLGKELAEYRKLAGADPSKAAAKTVQAAGSTAKKAAPVTPVKPPASKSKIPDAQRKKIEKQLAEASKNGLPKYTCTFGEMQTVPPDAKPLDRLIMEGRNAARSGNLELALEKYQTALPLQQTVAAKFQTLWQISLFLRSLGKYQQVHEACNEMLALKELKEDGVGLVLALQGDNYLRMGKLDEAFDTYEQAARKIPPDRVAYEVPAPAMGKLIPGVSKKCWWELTTTEFAMLMR